MMLCQVRKPVDDAERDSETISRNGKTQRGYVKPLLYHFGIQTELQNILASPLGICKLRQFTRSNLCCQDKMADTGQSEPAPKATPAELMLKVILAGTLSHFETRGMIDDKRLEHLLSAGKQILYKTHQESDVRLVHVPCYVGAFD